MNINTLLFLFTIASITFYFDALFRLNKLYNNQTLYIEPSYNNSHITFYELIDHCVTNYFIVFQNCFIFAFGSTCFVIDSCVMAYFYTIEYIFSYLIICADHILVFPNSILVFILSCLLLVPKQTNITP